MEIFSYNIIELIILCVLFVLLIIHLFYYFGIYFRIYSHNKAAKKQQIEFCDNLPPLSVIICACNESHNLINNLEAILQQDYPDFEVIVINDGLIEESEEFLIEMGKKYNNLYHSFTPEDVRNISNRKLAITLGIKASKYNWLVFTDADCRPVSNQWLRLMARNFTSTTDIVLGYSNYTYSRSWFNKTVYYTTLFQAMRFLGMSLNGKTYMGVGRNMAYRKQLFYDNKGFSHYLKLYRGEDDLFINEISKNANTRVETSSESIVHADFSSLNRIDWIENNINSLISAHYFQGSEHYTLGFETFTRFMFYATLIYALVISTLNAHWLLLALFFITWLIRFIIQAIVVNLTSKSLKEKHRYYLSLLLYDFTVPLKRLYFKSKYLKYKNKYDVTSIITHNA